MFLFCYGKSSTSTENCQLSETKRITVTKKTIIYMMRTEPLVYVLTQPV